MVNSYNDWPVDDGSIMGYFYEIESSSPAAFLQSAERITYSRRIFHLTVKEADLNLSTERIFNISLEEIKAAFPE